MVKKEKKHFLERNKVGPIADVKKFKADDKEDQTIEAMSNRETLGGNTFTQEDRHPKIDEGVSIYASSTILGNINVGRNSVVAAGSLVLDHVAENSTVAGIPAKKIK